MVVCSPQAQHSNVRSSLLPSRLKASANEPERTDNLCEFDLVGSGAGGNDRAARGSKNADKIRRRAKRAWGAT